MPPALPSSRRPLVLWLLGLSLLALGLAGGNAPPAAAGGTADPPPFGPARPVQPTPVPRGPFSALDPLGNPRLGYGFTLAARESDPRLVSDGFDYGEFEVDWGTSEPSPGNPSWGNVDHIVNAATAAGMRLILRVDQSPAWANGASAHGWYPPRDPADYGHFLGELAQHVRSLGYPFAPVYEVWNEPNISENWGGQCPDAYVYTQMLAAAYNAVKRADSGALVLGGAVTTTGERPQDAPAGCHVSDLDFLNQMYDNGANRYFDALSDHPYGFGDPPEADPRGADTLVFRRAELHREIMLAHGDSTHHIWITETGWAINPQYVNPACQDGYDWYYLWTPQQQADNLVRAFNWARSYWDWLDELVVFNFDYNRPGADQCYPFAFLGVLNRPAESALSYNKLYPPPTYTPLPTATPTPTTPPTPAYNFPPTLDTPLLTPGSYWRTGGPLTVRVDASDTDASPVGNVVFVVTFPDGTTQQVVPMTLLSGTSVAGTWQGTFQVPNPTGTTNQTYRIAVSAVDTAGLITQAPVVPFTVSLSRFVDVPAGFWAYPYIDYLAARGIVSGYADGTFRPYSNATRGQFAKMIVGAEAWPIITPPVPSFVDVPPGISPFYPYVETVHAHGIISGYGDGTFRPNAGITRGQIAKMIALAEAYSLTVPGPPRFGDVGPHDPFYPYVEAVAAHGIVSGYSDGSFRPNAAATRAQLSKMLYNMLTLRPPPTPTPTTPPATATATATLPPRATPSPTATGTPPTATPSVTGTRTAMPTATATAALRLGVGPPGK